MIQPEEHEDLPGFTNEDLKRGVVHIGGVTVRRGRPKAEVTKQPVNLRLSRDVVAYFRATGPGWQTRIDAVLRKAAKLK